MSKLNNKEGITVLSIFDGISCGQEALRRLRIPVKSYYASEIDKHAISVCQKNFPETIQLGDVQNLTGDTLPKIDLLIAGSPCQSFSKTISSNTGFDGKSKLFFEFVRILEEVKPRFLLLENVVMKKEWSDIITKKLGVAPVIINSALYSPQTRDRLYWANFPIPKRTMFGDGRVLNDILEGAVSDKYYYIGVDYKFHGDDTAVCATLNIKGHDILKRVNSRWHKCQTLTAVCGGNQQKKVLIPGMGVRKLTPTEYERLQGLPDGYTDGISDSQRYKAIGNGWQVDTIMHIFKGLTNEQT